MSLTTHRLSPFTACPGQNTVGKYWLIGFFFSFFFYFFFFLLLFCNILNRYNMTGKEGCPISLLCKFSSQPGLRILLHRFHA